MCTQELSLIFNGILKDIGYKRKSKTNWFQIGPEITKWINIQKSSSSGICYVNYGFIINGLPLYGTNFHVYLRLPALAMEHQKLIADTMDLDVPMNDRVRFDNFDYIIRSILIPILDKVQSEKDLKRFILDLPSITAIPYPVLEHFELVELARLQLEKNGVELLPSKK